MTRPASAPVIALSTVLAGCDKIATGPEPTPTPAPTRIEGTYTLRSIDGMSLPARLTFGFGASRTYQSGSITLNADGTFTTEDVSIYTDGETVNPSPWTHRGSGTYHQEGGVCRFRWQGRAQEVSAGIVDGQLTMLYGGDFPNWVYKR